MPCPMPQNLYNAVPRLCVYSNIYDKNNKLIGTYTGFSARPTATSNGHIEVSTPEGNLWISGEAVYIEGMGIKLISDMIVD
tara:strand:+ start:327 stop:569 length:243 start_codon:yes stop_codon:yes gene_type:complete